MEMTKAKQYAIRVYIAMRNHHERLLESAIQRNDANAVAHETAILSQIKGSH
jgi:hypothetical protein